MQTIKPGKQRKMLYKAPAHVRYRLFGAPLSPDLMGTHAVKTLPVRSGDTVRVMRGDHKGFEGKISRVDRKKYRVYVEGLTREKVDGTAIPVSVHPSKVMITRLNLDDKWRKKILERKRTGFRIVEKTKAQPPKEALEARKEIVEERAAPEGKLRARKPRAIKKRVTKRAAKKAEETAQAEEKSKAKKPRARRKATKKVEGGA
jgi:large subunit ribosomal protein L24